MRKQLLGFLCIFLIAAGLLGAQTTPVVPGDGTLKAAIAAANPGDVLVLEDGGEYIESADSAYFIGIPLTIMAAPGAQARPVLKMQVAFPNPEDRPKFFILGDGSSLKLQGLELDGMEPDVLAPDPPPAFPPVDDVFLLDLKDNVEVGFLKVYDCLIQNTSDNILEVWDPGLYGGLTGLVLDSIVVKNSLFYNTWRWGLRHVQNSYFELENCTFWDFPDFAIYARDSGKEFIINHCTFNNVGTEILWNAGSPDETLRFRGDAYESISITNSIFANGSTDPTIRTEDSSRAVISNILFWNTGASRLGDAVVSDTMNADPLFADAANGDFNLMPASPAWWAGSDGLSLGDLRWANYIPQEIPVAAGDGTLKAAIAAANPGDVLVLEDGGEYIESADSAYFIGIPLTIMAAPGAQARPVLKMQVAFPNPEDRPKFFILGDGSSLKLQGLELDGMEPDVLAPDPPPAFPPVDDVFLLDLKDNVEVGFLKVYDCLIQNTSDNILEVWDPGLYGGLTGLVLDSIVVKNSLFYNTWRWGLRHVQNSYFELENCTFWDFPDFAIYARDSGKEFIINHCTFNNTGTEIIWNAGSPDEILRFRGDTFTSITISNSIMANGSSDAPIRLDAGQGSVVSNVLFWNTSANTRLQDAVVTDTLNADPLFADPANGDFTLGAGSPAWWAGNDGKSLGDLRWAMYVPQMIPVAPGDGTLKAAIAAANPGDMLVLESGGEYTESADSVWFIGKHLTIMAAEDYETRPVLKNTSQQPYDPAASSPKFFMMGDGSSLKLMGLELDGGEPNVLAPDPVPTFQSVDDVFLLDLKDGVEVGFLKVYDCLIQNTSDNVLEVWDPDLYGALTGLVLDSIVVKDCLFYNTWRWGVRHVQNSYFELENCTFWDFPDFVVYARDAGTEMVINHCTFNNTGTEIIWNAGSPDEILRFRGDTFTSITISNSIMANGSSDAPIRLDAGQGSVVSNVLFWNTSANTRLRDAVVTDTLNADPLFADPANGDFTLGAGSPALGAGNDGLSLGDLRWSGETAVEEELATIPTEFGLDQNYPNPFNPVTTISFSLKKSAHTTLTVFNVMGQEVMKVIDRKMEMGAHELTFDASSLDSGIYFYRLKSGENISIKKMVLMK